MPYCKLLYCNADVCLNNIPSRFLATRQVPITSSVGVEVMSTATLFDVTMEGFPTLSLPKHVGNPDYAAIKEIHQLLTANPASVEGNLGGGQNDYLGLILLPEQYARVYCTASVRLPDPGRTAHVPEWMPPGEEKPILREYAEHRRMYEECRTIDTDLNNHLISSFGKPYLSTLKSLYMG